ncbi:polysaccharide pyruvyl transferase family protein [Streptomyces sp. TRM70308]|uniref:polysaccharide pyruvyl transferase family protein n=1 Tax=Streptomyces sp. TRM70308 TaxID=3131932 RepID=UPI003D020E06
MTAPAAPGARPAPTDPLGRTPAASTTDATSPGAPAWAAPAEPSRTGKRRVAFAAYVRDDDAPGLLALLRSLALSNPGVCEDFLVLHDDLRPTSVSAVRRLHPRVVFRPARGARELFGVRDYDTVVVLTPDTVVLGDLGPLLRLRTGFAAVRPGEGLMVLQRSHLTDALRTRLAAGESPADAVPGGDVVRLDARYDVTARDLAADAPVPDDAVVLRLATRHAPWTGGGDGGHAAAEAAWRRYALGDDPFAKQYLALPGTKHPDLVRHLGHRLVARTGDAGTARQVAAACLSTGDYQAAADVLGGVRIPVRTPWPHEVLGTALMALSRYDEAESHLLLATADPKGAANAYGRLAQLAWTRGEDAAAHRYATAGLGVDPLHRTCRTLHERTRPEVPASRAPEDPAEQLAHVAFYMDRQGNAGDKVLPEAVRRCFGPDTSPARWHAQHAHRLFDDAALDRVNARRGLVVGGGGLFIPDTAPNGHSAWQWNVPDAVLGRLRVPLAVFGVGYNAFDGQPYARSARFAASLRLLVAKSAFFGLRNHGSIERVRDLLPAELHDRVQYQPCPTTVTRHLVPGWQDPATREDTVLLNCAYDRAGLRFGHDYEHFLGELARAVTALRAHAEVRCVAHAPEDERVAHDLRRAHGISLPVVPLYDRSNDEIHAVYARTRLVVGMRGHAGMIPFGCGTPIISLVSHPKMAYFLADLGRPEWGVSVHAEHLAARLTERAVAVLDAHEAAVADVHALQATLWDTTRRNVAALPFR